ncbi:MAG: ribonuclease HI family protein [Candidatus Bathyarchaeota archaeon]|nr:ribonuclease HI family protein [Candidatus Bathyarchaeota archaeon]
MQLKSYSDGGARGNPGPAAMAYLLLDEKGAVVKSEARFLGRRTNNQAEYEGVIAALRSAASLGAQELVCVLDSQLVCRQLTGEYRVKNAELFELWKVVRELQRGFRAVRFMQVPRTNRFIQQADHMLNKCLDQEAP